MALILIGIFSILVSIQFFTTSLDNGIGILFIVLGVILIIIGAQRENEKKHDTQSRNPYTNTANIHSQTQPQFTKEQEIDIARKLLVMHYMQLAQDLSAEMDENDKKDFESKFPLVKASIVELISQKEKRHGTIFLTEDTEKNATAKYINEEIGKEAYAITLYYLLNFDEELKLFSRNEVVEAILYAFKQPNLDDEQMIHTILERLEGND